MCGLVGMAGDISVKDEKVFRSLLIIDVLRGEHSTGVAIVDKDSEEVSVVKQVGNTFELFNDKRYDKAMQGWQQVLLGHNRYATIGAVNKANAHPFQFNRVTGAHNGTLTSRYDLLDQKNFTTDSEALYNHINEKGVADAISHCRGAYALTWWDAKEKTINFLRNKERTLFICTADSGKTVYWASESWMLNAALGREGIKHSDPVLLDEDNWMMISVNQGVLAKPRFRKVSPPKYDPPKQLYHGIPGTTTAGASTIVQPGTSSTKRSVITGNFGGKSGAGLIGCKDILFELKSKQVDKNGGVFFECVDPIHRDYNVRFYVNTREANMYDVGDLIQGDINQWKDGYYKLQNSSVRVVDVPPEDEGDSPMYQDHKGHLLSKKDWERKYPNCEWCSADLVAGDGNSFSADGSVVCPHCAKDEDVKLYLRG